MSNKSPAFQFYPSDFLSDKNTMLMSAEEIGMYVLLMCVCWKEGSLPDDVEEMALLSRANVDDFKSSWENRISRCFIMNDHGEWVHPRLEKEREKQQKYRQKKAEAGRKGAKSRWGNADNNPQMAENSSAKAQPKQSHGTASDLPMAKNGPSSSTSSSTSDNKPYGEDFEDFWELYGVKKGKKKACQEWKRLTGSEKSRVMENVPIFLTHYSSKQYTPRPRKYLHNRYWEDEDYQKPPEELTDESGNPTKKARNQIRDTKSRADRYFDDAQAAISGFPEGNAL